MYIGETVELLLKPAKKDQGAKKATASSSASASSSSASASHQKHKKEGHHSHAEDTESASDIDSAAKKPAKAHAARIGPSSRSSRSRN